MDKKLPPNAPKAPPLRLLAWETTRSCNLACGPLPGDPEFVDVDGDVHGRIGKGSDVGLGAELLKRFDLVDKLGLGNGLGLCSYGKKRALFS